MLNLEEKIVSFHTSSDEWSSFQKNNFDKL